MYNYLYDKYYIVANQKTAQQRIDVERLLQAVEQMVNELVPIIIEKYLNENQEKMILSIETMINGSSVNSHAIIDSIQKEIANQLKF